MRQYVKFRSKAIATLTRKECPHAKGRLEARLLGNRLVLQAVLDIQGVREHDCLLIGDALAVVKVADHLDKVAWIAGVLADTRVDLGVCLGGVRMVDINVGGDGGICGSIALHGGGTDWLAESVEESWCTEGVGEGNAEDLYRLC